MPFRRERPLVVVARRLLPAGLALLERKCEVRSGELEITPARLRELVAGADALVADPTVEVGPGLLDAAGPSLRVVANVAVGYDNVDLAACAERGITVTNTPGVLTDATAELALALTLAAARGLCVAEADLRAGRWRGWDPGGYLGTELSGACFAVVGMGRIGTRYAELVRPLAGELLYVSPSRKRAAERSLGAERVSLAEALARALIVSLHAPAAPATQHMIGARELALMRPDAILINTARGSLIDADALAAALRERRLGAAGLDVYEAEPHVGEALLGAPRCVLLPHIGSATTKAREAMARTAAANVLAVLRGEPPPNPVS